MVVYHAKNLVNPFEKLPDFPEQYDKVATVDTVSLEVAYGLTNNIDKSWTLNKGVKAEGKEFRSTSVGDIIEDNNGVYWVCDFAGWKLLDSCKNQSLI